jgi:hypothetical protein
MTDKPEPASEAEQILLDDLTLDDVAAKTVAARRAAGETIEPEELASIKRRASEIIKSARERAQAKGSEPGGPPANGAPPDAGGVPSAVDGLEDARALSLAIGLPAARVLFESMIANCNATPARKKAMRRDAKKMSKLTEAGCVKVDFFNGEKGQADVAYLLLAECPPDHDLSAQVHKLFSQIPEERYDEIRKHLSMLVYLGRTSYAQMLSENEALVARIQRHMPTTFDARALRINPNNTTMYLGPDIRNDPAGWEPRVGIFVRLSEEAEAERAEAERKTQAKPGAKKGTDGSSAEQATDAAPPKGGADSESE